MKADNLGSYTQALLAVEKICVVKARNQDNLDRNLLRICSRILVFGSHQEFGSHIVVDGFHVLVRHRIDAGLVMVWSWQRVCTLALLGVVKISVVVACNQDNLHRNRSVASIHILGAGRSRSVLSHVLKMMMMVL